MNACQLAESLLGSKMSPPVIAPNVLLSPNTLDPTLYMLPKKTRRRRKVHELERNYQCAFEGCERRYASESALHQHLWLKHQYKRCRNIAGENRRVGGSTPYHISNMQRSASIADLAAEVMGYNEPGALVRQPHRRSAELDQTDVLKLLDLLSEPRQAARLAPITAQSLPQPLDCSPVMDEDLERRPSFDFCQNTPLSFECPGSSPLANPAQRDFMPCASPPRDLAERTDNELKAELRKLLSMFQTVEAMESAVCSRAAPIAA